MSVAERDLERASVTADRINEAVAGALKRIENADWRYEAAGPRERRELNQSFFEGFDIFEKGEVEPRRTTEYELLLHSRRDLRSQCQSRRRAART